MAYARDTAATDISRYPGHMPRISVGVQVKTLLVYHRKDKEFKGVERAAEILACYQKPKELEVPKEEICKEPKAEPCVVMLVLLKLLKLRLWLFLVVLSRRSLVLRTQSCTQQSSGERGKATMLSL